MDETPTHLDLFSGIGGFALAAQWAGFRTIGFCEIDRYCQKVLAKNFGAIPYAEGDRCGSGRKRGSDSRSEGKSEQALQASAGCRIFGDIFTLDGTQFRRNGCSVTLLTGGFPCQPFSVAGKRRGAADDRAIWPEMFRVINEARPAWVLGENVPGIIPMELDNVLSDLEGIGYATRAFVIPACAVDARHRRDRLWIVANASRDSERAGLCTREPGRIGWGRLSNGSQPACEWLSEPDVGRVAHGIPSRVDRLRGLGNAIVPQVAFEILREIRKLIL